MTGDAGFRIDELGATRVAHPWMAARIAQTGQMVKAGDRLDDAHEGVGLTIVEERLAQAGVRLADILNNAFGD
jgi:hypothetical protein